MSIIPITAKEEYERNPDIKKEEIDKLMDWVQKQPHLPTITEVELITFYHSCDNSAEFTKTTIDIYYTLRTHLDAFFAERDPLIEKNLVTLERGLYGNYLNNTTPDGYKVIYCRLLDYDPTHFVYDLAAKSFAMVTDLEQHEKGTFPGVVILVDLDKVSLGHLARLGIISVKNTLMYLQEAMPVRLIGFHFLNCPAFMDKILALMRPFMKKSFMDTLHLHPAPIDTVYKFVPKEMLPKDMGGKNPSYEEMKVETIQKFKANRQYFIDEEKKRIDESKRPGKPKDLGKVFGVEGSFKKLSID